MSTSLKHEAPLFQKRSRILEWELWERCSWQSSRRSSSPGACSPHGLTGSLSYDIQNSTPIDAHMGMQLLPPSYLISTQSLAQGLTGLWTSPLWEPLTLNSHYILASNIWHDLSVIWLFVFAALRSPPASTFDFHQKKLRQGCLWSLSDLTFCICFFEISPFFHFWHWLKCICFFEISRCFYFWFSARVAYGSRRRVKNFNKVTAL